MSNKGQFKKGKSGNPLGRPRTSAKDLVRMHPQKNELVQKLFDVAMDDGDQRQVSAWRILLPKMVPDLKAMQMEVEQKSITGVIVLPEKVSLDPNNVSTSKQRLMLLRINNVREPLKYREGGMPLLGSHLARMTLGVPGRI